MHLSHFAITKAKSQVKPNKLSDGAGLYLLIEPNGSKLWRFRYRFAGRENMLTFGPYPAVSLGDAREKRDMARKLLAAGANPSEKRKQEKRDAAIQNANTFGAIADEVLSNKEANEAAASTMDKNRWLLTDLAAPLTDRPITEITAAEILQLLKHIEKSGRRESARRLRGAIGSVFRYAIVTLRATNDPTLAARCCGVEMEDRPKVRICTSCCDWPTTGMVGTFSLLRPLTLYRQSEQHWCSVMSICLAHWRFITAFVFTNVLAGQSAIPFQP
jgi:Arm domain-containing DNA-binding protein/integrase-like protein